MSNPVDAFTEDQHAVMVPYLRSVNTRDVKTIVAVRGDKLKAFEYASTAQRYATLKATHAKVLARAQKKYDDDLARRQTAAHLRSTYSAWGTTSRGTTVLMTLASRKAPPEDPTDITQYTIVSKKELPFFFYPDASDAASYLPLVGTPELLTAHPSGTEVPVVDLRLCADAYLKAAPERSLAKKKAKKATSSPLSSSTPLKKAKSKKKTTAEASQPESPAKTPKKKTKKAADAPLSCLDGTQLALLPGSPDKPVDVAYLAQPDEAWSWPLESAKSTERTAVALNKNFMAQYSRSAAVATAALLNGACLTGYDIERYARSLLDAPEVQQLSYDAADAAAGIDANPLLQSDAVLDELTKIAFALTSDMILAHSLDTAVDKVIEAKTEQDQ